MIGETAFALHTGVAIQLGKFPGLELKRNPNTRVGSFFFVNKDNGKQIEVSDLLRWSFSEREFQIILEKLNYKTKKVQEALQ